MARVDFKTQWNRLGEALMPEEHGGLPDAPLVVERSIDVRTWDIIPGHILPRGVSLRAQIIPPETGLTYVLWDARFDRVCMLGESATATEISEGLLALRGSAARHDVEAE
jgi:hypothetical protein